MARLCLIQMSAVFVFSFPFAYSYFRGGSIIPPMIFHFLWNIYNPAVLGDIYRNEPGIMNGPIWVINGEGLWSILLGLTCQRAR
jgi:membrane protease YdiL (CAAX protease family)